MSKKNKSLILGKFYFKLLLLFLAIIGLLLATYLTLNKGKEPVSAWGKIKKIPSLNLFKFFGWKWNLIIFAVAFTAGILYRWPFLRLLAGWWERKKLIKFAEGVHMAMVSADVGRGKTLLLSILARHLPYGIKKMGFVSNVPDAQLLSYNDINFEEPISEMENYRIPKYYFIDELNFTVEGVNHIENKIYHKGVAWLLQICRHHQMRVWMSATRDNHVWVQVRQMANYYVKLGGLKYLMSLGRFTFYTQRVQFYSQNWDLEKEFNITISNLDFELYDSYWLKDTSYFRPTWEKIAAEKEIERAKKQAERELTELAEKNARGRQGKKYFSFPSEIKKEEVFSATSQPAVLNPPAPTKKKEGKLVPEEKSALKKKFPNHRRRISSLDDFISNYLKKEKEENDT